MCRRARIKLEGGIYHIMARCGSDIVLFQNYEDKDKFLEIVKKYKEVFMFKLYAYCVMDTHYHFLLASNGADISKIMQVINQSYAQYYNWKYSRRGNVFQDRFKSRIIDSNKYFYNVSSYIHNNPSDLSDYKLKIEKYPYSSLGIYLKLYNDTFKLIDTSIISERFSSNISDYFDFIINNQNNISTIQKELDSANKAYRNEKTILYRNLTPQFIIEFVSKFTQITKEHLYLKNHSNSRTYKGICIALIHTFSNATYKEICSIIGNLTLSSVSNLSTLGYSMLTKDERYKNLISKLLAQ
ncbi:MAG: transposase [Clostridiaceae bacterium]|nr:transposase [Clostridiaceae bacterium]